MWVGVGCLRNGWVLSPNWHPNRRRASTRGFPEGVGTLVDEVQTVQIQQASPGKAPKLKTLGQRLAGYGRDAAVNEVVHT